MDSTNRTREPGQTECEEHVRLSWADHDYRSWVALPGIAEPSNSSVSSESSPFGQHHEGLLLGEIPHQGTTSHGDP